MDHTAFFLQIWGDTRLSPGKHSLDGSTMDSGNNHLITAYYSFIDPMRMKGWVALVSGRFTHMVTHQLQVSCKRGKVHRTQTDVLPLSYTAIYKPLNINLVREADITLRGSLFLTAVDAEPTFDTLGYNELDCCDLDFFSASRSDNAIATHTHVCHMLLNTSSSHI